MAFHESDPAPSICTLVRLATYSVVSNLYLVHEQVLNVDAIFSRMYELRPVIQNTLDDHRKDGRKAAARGNLPHFDIGY